MRAAGRNSNPLLFGGIVLFRWDFFGTFRPEKLVFQFRICWQLLSSRRLVRDQRVQRARWTRSQASCRCGQAAGALICFVSALGGSPRSPRQLVRSRPASLAGVLLYYWSWPNGQGQLGGFSPILNFLGDGDGLQHAGYVRGLGGPLRWNMKCGLQGPSFNAAEECCPGFCDRVLPVPWAGHFFVPDFPPRPIRFHAVSGSAAPGMSISWTAIANIFPGSKREQDHRGKPGFFFKLRPRSRAEFAA